VSCLGIRHSIGMKRQHSLRHTALHHENSVLHHIDSAPGGFCTIWTQIHTGLHHVKPTLACWVFHCSIFLTMGFRENFSTRLILSLERTLAPGYSVLRENFSTRLILLLERSLERRLILSSERTLAPDLFSC
jgi:hypothetical protein